VGNTVPRSEDNYAVPQRVSPDTDWTDVTVGFNVVFALKSDGTLWAWGRHATLFTGSADSESKRVPTQIGTDRDWRECSCGATFVTLVKKDGSLWSLSSPDMNQPAELKKIELLKDFVAIGGGGTRLGVALTRDGEVWTWGKVIGEGVTTFTKTASGLQANEPKLVVLEKPWQLSNVDPADSSSK
jgi:alpha-tubulin suppressor-like RCC1 family protein